jgi:RNA polymerase sigma-70 factor (ECF subfamily)
MASGDHSAMTELYDQTSALVFGLALRIAGEHSAAEDVVVDVYAQAWKLAAEYDASRGSVVTWLLTMTRSRAIDLRRARRRDQATEPLEAADEVRCDRPGPEAISDAAQRHRFVRGALARLSAELRQVVELSYFAGYSHSEIAHRLGQPLGTVKTRIRSAMMQLRAELAGLETAPLTAKEKRL